MNRNLKARVKRCTAIHTDGRIYWRVLLPPKSSSYTHTPSFREAQRWARMVTDDEAAARRNTT